MAHATHTGTDALMTVATLLIAAVACAVVGMVIAFIGILTPGLFIPGTWLILIGLPGCVAAGVLALIPGKREQES